MRRLATALLTIAAVAALTACGTSTPDPTPTGTSGPPGTGTLGEGIGTTPTTTPTSTPTTAATATPGGGLPAPHSTIANKAGYAWVNQIATTYTAATAYQYNSAGGAINVAHLGTGSYAVYFLGLGTSGGVAHAQAYGSSANYCTVDSWYNSASDQEVNVSCFNAAGAAADSMFVVSFAAGSQGSARFSYLWAENASQTTKYQPSADYRYDAVASNKLTVQRTAAGRYEVYVPAAGNLTLPWTFQVTAYGSNKQCKLHGYSSSTRKAQIACRTPGGALSDTRFALSFASGASIVGRTDRPYGAFSEDSDGLETPSTGSYVVAAPGLGEDKGQVVAVSRGTSSTYCHVAGWGSSGSDLKARLVCFNPGGAAANSSFELAITL